MLRIYGCLFGLKLHIRSSIFGAVLPLSNFAMVAWPRLQSSARVGGIFDPIKWVAITVSLGRPMMARKIELGKSPGDLRIKIICWIYLPLTCGLIANFWKLTTPIQSRA